MSTSAASQDDTLRTEPRSGAPDVRRESEVRARQQEVVAQLGLSAIGANTVEEERLRRSERLASLGTLAAGIAHEINNPVNTILMTAESALLASEEGRSNGRLREDLSIIVQESHRCGEIVQRVLEFVRDGNLGREAEDVNDVVHAAVTLAETTLRDPAVPAVEVDLLPELPRVHLNRAEMEQVLLHLLRNAVESGDGEPVSTVVRTRHRDRRVVVTVEDDGRGIPPEVRDRIFDPFFTTRREQGATGLGLALAHSIVTDHGGILDVESEPGEGAVFRIELPIPEPAG